MATDLEICNAALMRLGCEPITALTDNTKRANLCEAHFDRLKADFLSGHPWNRSLKKTELTPLSVSIGSGDVDTGTDRITITGHGKSTGQRVVFTGTTISGGLNLGQEYYLIVIDPNTVELATTYALAQAGTSVDITSAVAMTMYYSALWDFAYTFSLPADYLQIFRVEPEELEYQVEEQILYSTDTDFRMIYQADVEASTFTQPMTQAFILYLAVEFSYTLIQSNELRAMLIEEADRALAKARLKDAQEGTAYPMSAKAWRQSRL